MFTEGKATAASRSWVTAGPGTNKLPSAPPITADVETGGGARSGSGFLGGPFPAARGTLRLGSPGCGFPEGRHAPWGSGRAGCTGLSGWESRVRSAAAERSPIPSSDGSAETKGARALPAAPRNEGPLPPPATPQLNQLPWKALEGASAHAQPEQSPPHPRSRL